MRSRLAPLRTAFLVLLALVAAYGVIGAFVVPPIARHVIVSRLEQKLGRHVTLDHVAIAPYSLMAQAKGLRIFERDGKTVFASFDTLDIDGSIASVRYLAPVVDQLRVGHPRLRVVREDAGRFNFSDIVDRLGKASPRKPGQHDEPLRFSASGIRIVDGAVELDDRVVHAAHRVDAIDVAVPFVSNLPTHMKDRVQPSFAASIDGSPMRLVGETHPFEDSLRTHFDVDLKDVDLTRYVAYLPGSVPLRIDSGKLDAHVSLRFSQGAKAQPAIDLAGELRLAGLALSSNEGALARFDRIAADIASVDPLHGRMKVKLLSVEGASAMERAWSIPALHATGIEADLPAHDIHVAAIETSGGQLALTRGSDGAVAAPPVPDFGPSSGPWKVAVANASVTGYKLAVRDETLRPPLQRNVVVKQIQARDVSLARGGSGHAEAALEIDGGGLVRVAADFGLEPLDVKAKLDARSIDLATARAYMKMFPAVELKGGTLSAQGDVSLDGSDSAMRVSYEGSAEVDGFSTWDSINREDLLKWKRVKASGIKARYAANAPLALAVADLDVDGAYSRIFVSPDGKLNVQQLMNATPQEPSPPPAAGPAQAVKRDIRVERIRFKGSRLNFTDHYIRPNYTADVGSLHGTVKGLSSDPASRATVLLQGAWDGSSPVMIAGTVNPLAGDLFLDIGAKGENIDLTKLSTYSQHYAGYKVDSGSLSLDVKYHIEGGKMEGRNRILVDHLALGDKVESPDATSLPVKFLINLLKDKDGRINLVLPISGSLDDPKFDIMAVVSQMFSGPLEKAKTSPFSLLAGASADGSANGGDLAYVDFAPGESTLTDAARAKLASLAQLLQDHPGVHLAIAPARVSARDAQALKSVAVQRALAAAPKDLPKEARDQIAQSVEITPQDRQALAEARVQHVQEFLATNGKLGGDRIVASNEAQPAPDAGSGGTGRVDFALR